MCAYVRNESEDAIDLEKEYSPSRHTKRFQQTTNPDESVLQHFMKITGEQTDDARAKYKTHLDIGYGNRRGSAAGDNKLLDIYYKDMDKDTPIFVYIHGGYFQAMEKQTSGSFVEPMIELGYRVVVVDYNLCPVVTLESLGNELGEFFEWLFEYVLETNCSKIVFAGHSAGAYLCTLLFQKRYALVPKVQHISMSFILISGIYDMRECWQLEIVNPNNILSLDETDAERMSPMCWRLNHDFVTISKEKRTEFHVLVAENDSETFREQSREFAGKLEKNGLQVYFKMFEIYDHFSIIEEVPISGSAINTYLLEHFKIN